MKTWVMGTQIRSNGRHCGRGSSRIAIAQITTRWRWNLSRTSKISRYLEPVRRHRGRRDLGLCQAGHVNSTCHLMILSRWFMCPFRSFLFQTSSFLYSLRDVVWPTNVGFHEVWKHSDQRTKLWYYHTRQYSRVFLFLLPPWNYGRRHLVSTANF